MEFSFLIRGLFAVGKMSYFGVVPIMGWWLQAFDGVICGNHRGSGMFSGFIDVVATVRGRKRGLVGQVSLFWLRGRRGFSRASSWSHADSRFIRYATESIHVSSP